MMNIKSIVLPVIAVAFVSAVPAFGQVIQNGPISSQTAAFDSTITSNGGTVTLDTLSNLSASNSWTRSGYTIASTDGSSRAIDSLYLPQTTNSAGAVTGGDAIGIDPYGPPNQSGLTFTFANPINAFGLEIGDWATCCYLPSSLYISFDGGATRLVASAFSATDNPGYVAGDGFRNFVGAFDSSNTFKTVSFYGDGFGEYLVAGGTIRYGTVDIGSIPDDPAVPEPATWAMMLLGFGGIGSAMRRQKRNQRLASQLALEA